MHLNSIWSELCVRVCVWLGNSFRSFAFVLCWIVSFVRARDVLRCLPLSLSLSLPKDWTPLYIYEIKLGCGCSRIWHTRTCVYVCVCESTCMYSCTHFARDAAAAHKSAANLSVSVSFCLYAVRVCVYVYVLRFMASLPVLERFRWVLLPPFARSAPSN